MVASNAYSVSMVHVSEWRHRTFHGICGTSHASHHTRITPHPHPHRVCFIRYITVAKSLWVADFARAVKVGFPDSRMRPPIATIPKWLLWLIGPMAGMSRDIVT
mgnify:CR=1 FL=1